MRMPADFERMTDAWRNAGNARRLVFGLPATALIVAAVYIGVIEPLDASSANLRALLPSLEARRDVVRAQAQELRSQAVRPAASAALDAVTVQAALARHRLADMQPVVESKGDNRIRLNLPRAPFFAIWPLFQTLQNDHGVRIVSLRVDRLDAANARVEAMLAAGDR
jgi:type II secretory pathway component PulM